MISCERFMAELGEYLEGDAAAGIRRQLEEHLSHCRTCWVTYDSVRKTLRIVTDSACFDVSEALSESIIERVMARVRP